MAAARLRCSVQNYDWGRKGREGSAVARLFERNSGERIDLEKPYAELWMGTHESGPSFLVGGGETLKSWILENPRVLGEKVLETWGGDLPFLFKVLSVAKALSIQAHPDKELAKILNKRQPNLYKDSNHKPEMAIAITEFKLLCGFVSIKELKHVLINVPEITELVGDENASNVMNIKDQDRFEEVKAVLQSLFTKLMSASKDSISEVVLKLTNRLNAESKIRVLTEKEQLVLLLEKQYPADVGVISAFFFNYVKLSPGEALYIGANEPHAYVSGECIECMATSDNVVRAGLTPKYRDVQTLCSMLTYRPGFPEILRGIPLNPYMLRYTPPFDEFEVDHCLLPSGESVVLSAVPGPSLFLVVAGEARLQIGSAAENMMAKEGDVLFVPALSEIQITADPAGTLQLYRAGVNSRFFD
ncbi:mannose-6-phosphate isomerase 2-like isoform X2 [Iris pallida]|uniref:Mannose-6-phosphate isomerase n=1 Tax=Iris pallida TaxID=29817 RepID=A0AAX6FUK2_IRIPA|nr:mannose-6-phosphate isomerase 2-like isoform X2 [Iris pallida]KAJ6833791.1 mannose-6-phosphate isomerase 2-like isoform X2 [Iris pallida]